jgi:hypothetical protein
LGVSLELRRACRPTAIRCATRAKGGNVPRSAADRLASYEEQKAASPLSAFVLAAAE